MLPNSFVAVVCNVWWGSIILKRNRQAFLTQQESQELTFNPPASLPLPPPFLPSPSPSPILHFFSPPSFSKIYQRQPDMYLLLKCTNLRKQQGTPTSHAVFFILAWKRSLGQRRRELHINLSSLGYWNIKMWIPKLFFLGFVGEKEKRRDFKWIEVKEIPPTKIISNQLYPFPSSRSNQY